METLYVVIGISILPGGSSEPTALALFQKEEDAAKYAKGYAQGYDDYRIQEVELV